MGWKCMWLFSNFSNFKNCLTLSSHISGLQALKEHLKWKIESESAQYKVYFNMLINKLALVYEAKHHQMSSQIQRSLLSHTALSGFLNCRYLKHQ